MTLHDLTPTGSLRAAINLGNPVLTHGTPAAPGGVTVAIAGEVARRLGVPLELVCVDAARKSFTSLVDGSVDVSFLAIEPAREEDVAFSPPYLAIEGVYVVPVDAPFGDASEVDRPGVTIGVKEGSASTSTSPARSSTPRSSAAPRAPPSSSTGRPTWGPASVSR